MTLHSKPDRCQIHAHRMRIIKPAAHNAVTDTEQMVASEFGAYVCEQMVDLRVMVELYSVDPCLFSRHCALAAPRNKEGSGIDAPVRPWTKTSAESSRARKIENFMLEEPVLRITIAFGILPSYME